MSDRIVYRRPDGTWVNQRTDADRASSVHGTQADAYERAREMSRGSGGGEITVSGVDGRFRYKNTIAPGNDDYPPEG